MEDKKIGQYRPREFLWLGETSESIYQENQVQIGLVATCPPTVFNFEQTGVKSFLYGLYISEATTQGDAISVPICLEF
jgi:hypothetical protein